MTVICFTYFLIASAFDMQIDKIICSTSIYRGVNVHFAGLACRIQMLPTLYLHGRCGNVMNALSLWTKEDA